MVLVRPAPNDHGLTMPHFLVLTLSDQRYVPALLEYHDAQQTRRGSFIFQTMGFPTMSWSFQQAEPFNQCVWATDCSIAVGNHVGARLYAWGEQIPIFLVLRETQRLNAGGEATDDSDGPPFGNSTSCGSEGYDVATEGSNDTFADCGSFDEEPDDTSTMMHLFFTVGDDDD